jgi:predicted permease
MDPRTIQFIAFCVFNALCLAGGYAARRRGLMGEHVARPMHLLTVSFIWGGVALLSIWRLPPEKANLWLIAIEPLLVVIPAFAMIPVARWMGCDDKQTGVLATSAGLGNLGFTLGAYLCYTLLGGPGGDGDAALAYAVAQVNLMAMAGVLALYPLARHFGEQPTDGISMARLIVTSFLDLRALMVHCAILGCVLAYTGVPYPGVLDRLHTITILFYLGGFGGYFAIGLRLRLGDTRRYLKEHALLAAVKFAGIPLLSLGLLALVNLTPAPLAPLGQKVVLVEAFMPIAIQSVMIANLFHLDGRMASTLWLVNTALFVTLPLPALVWWLS